MILFNCVPFRSWKFWEQILSFKSISLWYGNHFYHMDNRTNNRLTCMNCTKTFTTIGNLERHEPTVQATVVTRYQCWYYDKLYAWRENFAQHIRKLHPDQDTNITKKLITNPKTTAIKPGPWIPPAEALTKNTYRLKDYISNPEDQQHQHQKISTIDSRMSIKKSKLHKYTYTNNTMSRLTFIQLRQLHIRQHKLLKLQRPRR